MVSNAASYEGLGKVPGQSQGGNFTLLHWRGPWRTDVFSCLLTLTAGVNWGLPCKTVSIFANPYWSWNPRAASGCCICYRGKGIGPNKLLMKSDIAAGWELIPPCETTPEWPVWVSSGGGSLFVFFFGSMFHPNSISTWDAYPIRLSYMIKLVCPSMVILCHIYIYLFGWWFGTFFIFHFIYGIILPIDFHIFQRGWNHQPDTLFGQCCPASHDGRTAADYAREKGHQDVTVRRASFILGFAWWRCQCHVSQKWGWINSYPLVI